MHPRSQCYCFLRMLQDICGKRILWGDCLQQQEGIRGEQSPSKVGPGGTDINNNNNNNNNTWIFQVPHLGEEPYALQGWKLWSLLPRCATYCEIITTLLFTSTVQKYIFSSVTIWMRILEVQVNGPFIKERGERTRVPRENPWHSVWKSVSHIRGENICVLNTPSNDEYTIQIQLTLNLYYNVSSMTDYLSLKLK